MLAPPNLRAQFNFHDPATPIKARMNGVSLMTAKRRIYDENDCSMTDVSDEVISPH
jgi:hypothetical protein